MSDTVLDKPGDGSADAGERPLDRPPTVELAPAADRGTLEVRDRVVERIVELAALETDGVVRHRSTLDRVTGRDLPRVDATIAGDRVRVRADVAVAWPASLADTAGAVRERVTERLATLSGLSVDAVDVTVAHVEVPQRGDGRRAVVDVPDDAQRPAGASAPKAFAPAARWSVLLAVVVTALGLVLLRDALVTAGAISGSEWVTPFVADLASAPTAAWAVPAAVVAIVVGLLLLRAVFWPRRTTHIALGDDGVVWLRRKDLGKLAKGRAEHTDGVVKAAAVTGRKSVTVHVRTTTADISSVSSAVKEAVESAFAGINPSPSVSVKARPAEGVTR